MGCLPVYPGTFSGLFPICASNVWAHIVKMLFLKAILDLIIHMVISTLFVYAILPIYRSRGEIPLNQNL